ncbi:MAG: lipopolysaccharide heptosyltransferase I [Parachlamydiaceae bacterium]|nr:lipopolysaccharide heptosyltransferase I [Parachlamydiaceae bacterium]
MKRFLIVKTSALGDLIHVFPVVAYLKSKYPDCQIDWVVESQGADLVRAHPYVTRTLIVQTKKWRKAFWSSRTEMLHFRKELQAVNYDCIFDLQGNFKSGLLTRLAQGKQKVGFAWKSVPEWPNTLFTRYRYNPPKGNNIRLDYLSIVQQHFQDSHPFVDSGAIDLKISEEQQQQIEKLLDLVRNQKVVMVCPGSAWRNKQLSEGALEDFLKRLQAHWNCHFLLMWGSPDEREWVLRLQQQVAHATVVDRLPFAVLQQLMSRVQLVVAMDSLPLHLAGTTQTPTFSVFGPSLAHKYAPIGVKHQALQGTCPYGKKTFVKRCPILRTCPTGACIREISGAHLFKQFLLTETSSLRKV